MHISELAVVYRPIAELQPAARNPRTHSAEQIRQIADSLKRFGFTNPILVDNDLNVIAGHGRLEAAKTLNMDEVPTISIEGLSKAELHAYTIADNKLAENAGWDPELLALEFQYIVELDNELDLTITGFEAPKIDVMLSASGPSEQDPADEVPCIDSATPPVSEPGDLWCLGEHRLLCGDATDAAAFKTLMGDDRAQMVFIDPPYNVPIDGHVCGSGAIKHREFAMASGEMTEDEFTTFLKNVFRQITRHSEDGSIHFVCMDWRHLHEIVSAGRAVYSDLKNLCVWNKDNGGMGSLYRSKHELVFVFKHGDARHINNVELGRHGRYRTNVWDYPGVNTMRNGRLEELAMHPTVKPVQLVADAILDCSTRGSIILDCFGGSGTTLVAAEQTRRHARLMELDPHYVDVIIQRYQQTTGNTVFHEYSGKTFEEMAPERATECARSASGESDHD